MKYCWTCFKANGFDVPVTMWCIMDHHDIVDFGVEEE